jgi:NAD(P)-dependent dehydrogenase (short-subunit alcohol dehydrogenase family)
MNAILYGYEADREANPDHWRTAGKISEDVAVYFLGALRMTRLALPMLRASGGGAVVYISPAASLADRLVVSAFTPRPGQP